MSKRLRYYLRGTHRPNSTEEGWRSLICAVLITAFKDDDWRFLQSNGCMEAVSLAFGWSLEFAQRMLKGAVIRESNRSY